MKVGNGKFLALRGKMTSIGMTPADLADEMNRLAKDGRYGAEKQKPMTKQKVEARINGKTHWLALEALLACDALEIPHGNILEYFVDAPASQRPKRRKGRPTLATLYQETTRP